MNESQENSLDAGGAVAIEPMPSGSKNLIRDFFGILFDPIKTFRNVLAAKYWVGIFVIVILIMAASEIIYHPVLVDLSVGNMMKSEQVQSNPEAAQKGEEFLRGPIYRVIAPISIAIIPIVLILLWAGLSFFLASVVFGGTAKFNGIWIVCVWSSAIMVLGQIIRTPLIIATKNIEAGINLGLVFSENLVGTKIHKAMSVIDLFGIWYFIAVGIGLATLYKFTAKKGIGIASIVWIVLTLIGIIIALVSKSA